MKISLIVTVYNEERSLAALISSVKAQTRLPDEVVMVDGGSTDKTWSLLTALAKKDDLFRVFQRKGNISVGRNYAVKQAKHGWIAMSDAGCVLSMSWLAELEKKQASAKVNVVAGFYNASPTTPFEEAVVPYALVMPDQVDPKSFLPASRSLLIAKTTFLKYGGFDESLDFSEDFVLAKQMELAGEKMAFAGKAIVTWQPRKSLPEFAGMIFNFALFDVKAGIWRKKVKLIFVRYFVFALFLSLWMEPGWWIFGVLVTVSVILYLLWAVLKNYKYVKRGWYWLPVLQVVSDMVIMTGSVIGVFEQKSVVAEKTQA